MPAQLANGCASSRRDEAMSRRLDCRSSRAQGYVCAIGIGLLPLTFQPAQAHAESAPEPEAPHEASGEFPTQLAINVVANEGLLSTFEQRVSSWFTDGTSVSVTVTSEADLNQLLASDPSEVRAWVVPLSAELALVTFSCVTPHSQPRHLVREVRLRNGFDELGQERLASIVHGAFIALREGSDGFERADAERALGEVGIGSGVHAALVTPAPSARQTAPASPERSTPKGAARPAEPARWLLLAAGYGGKLRGPGEGIGHGPSVALGVQWTTPRLAIDLLLSGQFLFRSQFEAERFDASTQVSALRAHLGIEPALGSGAWAQVLLGAGADIARVRSSSTLKSSSDALETTVRESGVQWRAVGQLDVGVLRRWQRLDVGVYAQLTLLLEDVHYSVSTDQGERRLVTPWPVQLGLLLQGRFRSAL